MWRWNVGPHSLSFLFSPNSPRHRDLSRDARKKRRRSSHRRCVSVVQRRALRDQPLQKEEEGKKWREKKQNKNPCWLQEAASSNTNTLCKEERGAKLKPSERGATDKQFQLFQTASGSCCTFVQWMKWFNHSGISGNVWVEKKLMRQLSKIKISSRNGYAQLIKILLHCSPDSCLEKYSKEWNETFRALRSVTQKAKYRPNNNMARHVHLKRKTHTQGKHTHNLITQSVSRLDSKL